MTNKTYRQLILAPLLADWQIADSSGWLAKLVQCGLIGRRVDHAEPTYFRIGEQFLQYFSFMGCSPAVEFEPASDGDIDWHNFIFIHIPETLPEVKWLADEQTAKPACPLCHKRTRDWSDALQMEQLLIQCPNCSESAPVCDWNWHDSGGCARQFICIVNVYPREAIPSDHFLKLLADVCGIEWRFFYVNAPLLPS